MSLPTETDIGKALDYLARTDEKYAVAKAGVEGQKHRLKVVKAIAMLECGEKSVASQETHALVSDEYRDALLELDDLTLEYETISAKRKRAELVIDVWRSVNANRRQGQ